MNAKTLQKSTYIVNLGNHRVRVRADHRIMLAMLPVIMAAREAVQASGQTGRAA